LTLARAQQPLVSSAKSVVMPENKLSSFLPPKKRPSQDHNGNDQGGLRLQLENEIDKLALLMQEVRKQSARVQAAADAIGDRMLLDTTDRLLSINAHGNNRSEKLPLVVDHSSL
jgi:hypothetical protein